MPVPYIRSYKRDKKKAKTYKAYLKEADEREAKKKPSRGWKVDYARK